MTVRFYSSLDAGAPALSGSRLIDRVKQILLACLVNGYGSKPAAGWAVGHEHADGFSLGNGEGFVNLVSLGNSSYAAYILEAITDGSTALAGGVNRRSGPWYDGSTENRRQVFYSANFTGGANPHWAVVADDKTCILQFGYGISTADGGGQCLAQVFGRYLNAAGLGGFCSLGGAASATSSGNGSLIGFSGAVSRNPFTGLADQGASPLYACLGAAYQSGAGASRSPLQPDRLVPVRAGLLGYGAGISGGSSASTAVFCGQLRGILSEPVLSAALASQVLPLLGSSNTWQARVTLVTLANGKQLMPLFPSTVDQGFFVSLDAADWE